MFGLGNFWDKSPSWFLKILKLPTFHSGNFKMSKNALRKFIPNAFTNLWLLVIIYQRLKMVILRRDAITYRLCNYLLAITLLQLHCTKIFFETIGCFLNYLPIFFGLTVYGVCFNRNKFNWKNTVLYFSLTKIKLFKTILILLFLTIWQCSKTI